MLPSRHFSTGVQTMRRKNWRVLIVGIVLLVLAVLFFLYMLSIASRSNDPVGLMQTVGQVSGVVGGIGTVMAIFGFIGKNDQPPQ
jgi:hypothetical protein